MCACAGAERGETLSGLLSAAGALWAAAGAAFMSGTRATSACTQPARARPRWACFPQPAQAPTRGAISAQRGSRRLRLLYVANARCNASRAPRAAVARRGRTQQSAHCPLVLGKTVRGPNLACYAKNCQLSECSCTHRASCALGFLVQVITTCSSCSQALPGCIGLPGGFPGSRLPGGAALRSQCLARECPGNSNS